MGQQFDRVAIALAPSSTEYVVLEPQLLADFGQGQGPKGGVITVKDGWMSVQGAGEARLSAGQEAPGGAFPPNMRLTGNGKLAVEISAHADPTGNLSNATVCLEGASARLRMRDANGNDHTLLDGAGGNLWLGGKAADGDVVMFKNGETDNRNAAKATIHLDGNASRITLRSAQHEERLFIDGANGDVWLGGKNASGDLMLYHTDEQQNRDSAKATIRLNGGAGQIVMRAATGEDRILVDASKGDVWLGGKDVSGDIMLFHEDEEDNRNSAKATVRLNGGSGDVVLRNADCAEDFDIAGEAAVEPGTVMVIDADGRLSACSRPYDRCVAGVVSGAGDLKPGIVLGRQPDIPGRRPIALTGRVWCRVEASSAPIETGDLLTTSCLPGFAMKAVEPTRAFGAVIGKALAPLAGGQSLIPVLVALQ
jgi:hypothetical protein